MKAEQALITSAVNAWKATIERADKLFSPLSEEQLQKEVAPGKNRLVYLWGHLTAVHDRMLPLLSLSERLHPEFDALFLSSPDKAVAKLPASTEIKKSWMRSTADCSPVLKASQRMSGCRNTPPSQRKTLPRIRHATGLPFCLAEPVISRFIWDRLR